MLHHVLLSFRAKLGAVDRVKHVVHVTDVLQSVRAAINVQQLPVNAVQDHLGALLLEQVKLRAVYHLVKTPPSAPLVLPILAFPDVVPVPERVRLHYVQFWVAPVGLAAGLVCGLHFAILTREDVAVGCEAHLTSLSTYFLLC